MQVKSYTLPHTGTSQGLDMLKTSLVVLLVAASPVLGQQGGMAEADANKDNKVDAAELKTYVLGKGVEFDRFDELMKELLSLIHI